MLRIAVQSKGRLYDETMMLLEEAGIKLNRGKRILLLSAKGFPVEVLFLRDDDIPQSVANGVADIGIVGENEYVEKGQEAKLIKRLGFSKCRLSLAIPKDEEYKGAEWLEVVLPCEALLIANNNLSKEKLEILDELLFRFEAIQVAEGKKYVLLNAPKEKLDEIIEVLPGMKSPTITPLANDEWVSVQSVIAEKHFWEIIGKLKSLGAEGILVLPIEKMIV